MVVGKFQWIYPKTVDGSKRDLRSLWPPGADLTPWDCVGLGFEVESKIVATLGTGVCQLFWLLMLCKAHANICQIKDGSTSTISLSFGSFQDGTARGTEPHPDLHRCHAHLCTLMHKHTSPYALLTVRLMPWCSTTSSIKQPMTNISHILMQN